MTPTPAFHFRCPEWCCCWQLDHELQAGSILHLEYGHDLTPTRTRLDAELTTRSCRDTAQGGL